MTIEVIATIFEMCTKDIIASGTVQEVVNIYTPRNYSSWGALWGSWMTVIAFGHHYYNIATTKIKRADRYFRNIPTADTAHRLLIAAKCTETADPIQTLTILVILIIL